MKTHARVVVIGGGVVGVGTLYHLAKKGWSDVVLIERKELTSGSTWHAAGLLPLFNLSYSVGQIHKYSVKLYDYCLRAESIGKGAANPSLIYVLRNSGDKTCNIITFALRDAIVSEIQFQSHLDDMPTEQFKLNFTEILWTYSVQSADMQSKGNVAAGWSLTRNRPITQFT